MTFPLEWYLLFLVSIPQVYITILLGLALFNLSISWRQLLLISIIGGAIAFMVRLIPMIFGLSSVIGVIVLAILMRLIGKIKLSHALCISMASLMTIAVIECCIIPICLHLTNLTFIELEEKQIYLFLFFIPEAIVTLLFYLLTKMFKFQMWDLNEIRAGSSN